MAIDIVSGATVIEVSVGAVAVTVSWAVPWMLGVCVEVAVMVIGPPAETPDARPAALIVAMATFEEVQLTVTAPEDPSEKCPVAVNV
jgi:uncharacterized membrane protein